MSTTLKSEAEAYSYLVRTVSKTNNKNCKFYKNMYLHLKNNYSYGVKESIPSLSYLLKASMQGLNLKLKKFKYSYKTNIITLNGKVNKNKSLDDLAMR